MNNVDKKWKTVDICGNRCWCRSIVTIDATDDQIREDSQKSPEDKTCFIIGSGHLSIKEAEYFVMLHNDQIKKTKEKDLQNSN